VTDRGTINGFPLEKFTYRLSEQFHQRESEGSEGLLKLTKLEIMYFSKQL
jgi:hypothetical protein